MLSFCQDVLMSLVISIELLSYQNCLGDGSQGVTAKFATNTVEKFPGIPPILTKIRGNYGKRL